MEWIEGGNLAQALLGELCRHNLEMAANYSEQSIMCSPAAAIYLAGKGVYLNPRLFVKIENAVAALNHAGVIHNDLHMRNVMVSGALFDDSGQEDVALHVIDFGVRKKAGQENSERTTIANLLDMKELLYPMLKKPVKT